LLVAFLAAIGAMIAAALLASLALRPIVEISQRLETLTQQDISEPTKGKRRTDAVVRVAATIDRLGQQMRTAEAGYTALQANLNQMLDTLRDGVLLFTPERRAVMVSDAVQHFVGVEGPLVGRQLEEIFLAYTSLGAAVLDAYHTGAQSARVDLEDGRVVDIAIDHFSDSDGDSGAMGTLVTLRDTETAARLEQEMEVSRRLAAIGKLTAGVGHEVKNPINAMVVHLELLKGKLAGSELPGAQRHVEILAGEMQRLDRVVQTLADFSRPIELHLADIDLRSLIDAVVELTNAEMAAQRVEVRVEVPDEQVCVRVDGEMIRQALLNLVLNAMQAMPQGGTLRLALRRERQFAVLEVADQGEGIAPEIMPRIFDLYFTTKPTGSGIGLATTYRILQMHGGALEVRSTNDASQERGTTFTLRLPVSAVESRESRRPAS
jgi:signal transduction histidine kinase